MDLCLWLLLLAVGRAVFSFSLDRAARFSRWRLVLGGAALMCAMPGGVTAFLELPVEEGNPPPLPGRLARRDDDVFLRAWLDGPRFFAQMNLSAKDVRPQEFSFNLDTGSEVSWVPHFTVCTKEGSCPHGSYSEFAPGGGLVSTYRPLHNPHNYKVNYFDGSHSKGVWFADDVQMPGADLAQIAFGLSETGPSPGVPVLDPILGLADHHETRNPPRYHPPFLQKMREQGFIQAEAFSMWMPRGGNTGSVLFGAVDSTKFDGRLMIVPHESRRIKVAALWLSNGALANTGWFFAFVDSGAASTYLPKYMIDNILPLFEDPVYEEKTNLYRVTCPTEEGAGRYLTLEFEGAQNFQLRVDRELFVLRTAPDTCYLLLQVKPEGVPITLGSAFFRAAYLVFDNTGQRLGIGQKNDHPPAKGNPVAFEDDPLAPMPAFGIDVCTQPDYLDGCKKYLLNTDRGCVVLEPPVRERVQSARMVMPGTRCEIFSKAYIDKDGSPVCKKRARGDAIITFAGTDRIGPGMFGGEGTSSVQGFWCFLDT